MAIEDVIKSLVLRGGSWYYHAGYARSARRYRTMPKWRVDFIGFRVVISNRKD